MRLELNENIRRLRKDRSMTQEQLAEAMGVSVGAVSKWESGQTNPELGLIAELADFFGVSVDALLGYTLKSGSRENAIAHIKKLNLEKRFDEAPAEIAKLLQKFPNCFDIVYNAANLFSNLGLERHDTEAMNRAMELFERSCDLIDQNTDPEISRSTIQNRIAMLYAHQEKYDKAIELMRQNNANGMNNVWIGNYLIYLNKHEEALPVLSESLLDAIITLPSTVIGMSVSLAKLGKADEAIAMTDWIIGVLQGLEPPNGEPSYILKMSVCMLTFKAMLCYNAGNERLARECFARAAKKARQFDRNPSFSSHGIRFYHGKDHTFYDNTGETAMDAVERILSTSEEPKAQEALLHIWKEVRGEVHEDDQEKTPAPAD